MDPRTIEINNLRILNDYLNQTIEVIARTRAGVVPGGLSHSPFTSPVFGFSPWGNTVGASPVGAFDPTTAGLGHSQFGVPFGGAMSPFGVGYNTGVGFNTAVDPFAYARGLAHTPAIANAFAGQGYGNPVADVWRQQQLQQQYQAIATLRAMGVPV